MAYKNTKIGIMARDLSKKGGGTKVYIENILKKLDSKKTKNSFHFIHNSKKHNGLFPNLKETYKPTKNKLLFDYFIVPRWAKDKGIDVLFSPKNTLPFRLKPKKAVTVHDLAYFLPKYNAYPVLDRIYMKNMIKNSCKRADIIFAPSENTKKDIKKYLDISPRKIKVIHSAANNEYRKVRNKQKKNEVRKKYNLPEKFCLFTGGLSPRKNITRLIKAFNHVSSKIPQKLVLTGGHGWEIRKIKKMIKNNKNIKKIGFVDDEDMATLYTLADFYIYPSLYEGFGLPVLEAQSCQTPLVASNVSSIPEVAGRGAHYVNPQSAKEIGEAILLLSKNKKYKQKLIKKGLENSKKFSWQKTTDQIVKNLINI